MSLLPFAGIRLMAAGLPCASLVAFDVLGMIQIGPTVILIPVIIWSWMTMEMSTARSSGTWPASMKKPFAPWLLLDAIAKTA
jgi:hypothetical protein